MICVLCIFHLGPDHPEVAISLHNLAVLYHDKFRYADAEPLYRRSLTILEQALGPEHPNVAISLYKLAEVYQSQGRHSEAKPLFRRAAEISEETSGPNHPN